MNTDHTFQIGKDHTVCEDYALSGVKLGAYAIVCDGCSASPDVDFGARALAFSATRTLPLATDYTPERFGEITIRAADRVFAVFPHLHPQALDATLLAAWVENKKLTACLYGDGVFIHKTKNGIRSIHIRLTSGAPDYLSYHLDQTRMDSYMAMKDNNKEVIFENFGSITSPETKLYKPFEPVVVESSVEEGDIIAVISDGINSFRKIDNESINWKDLIDEFTGYKTTEGQFVLRRISAFKRKCQKEGTTHSDDISIASIVI